MVLEDVERIFLVEGKELELICFMETFGYMSCIYRPKCSCTSIV